MSEEDISQIESALCSEEGKKILQQTSLEDLASPLNSMEEDEGEETGPPTEEDGLNGTDMSIKLVEGDFELEELNLKVRACVFFSTSLFYTQGYKTRLRSMRNYRANYFLLQFMHERSGVD